MNIVYMLDKFPVISETFVMNEIMALLDLGHNISIISLYTPDHQKTHDEIDKYELTRRAQYLYHDYGRGLSVFFKVSLLAKIYLRLSFDRTLTINEKIGLFALCRCEEESMGSALKRFPSYVAAASHVKEKKIKHIHCHFASDNVKIAYAIHQILGIPYTFTTHAIDIFVNPNKHIKRWADHAKNVIAVSRYNMAYMHDTLDIPSDKMALIAYGIYVDEIMPVRRWKMRPLKIVSVSRLVEKKGYPYLIKACRILKDKGIDFSCEIQGDGVIRRELENNIKENGLEDRVKLGTFLNHLEVLDFIASGSIFVLPCIKTKSGDMDGIPNTLMEAMAIEIPVVSTGITGIPELIDGGVNGIIVPQQDPGALAEAIIQLEANPDFADMVRKKGREKIKEKFNIHKNILQLVEIFSY